MVTWEAPTRLHPVWLLVTNCNCDPGRHRAKLGLWSPAHYQGNKLLSHFQARAELRGPGDCHLKPRGCVPPWFGEGTQDRATAHQDAGRRPGTRYPLSALHITHPKDSSDLPSTQWPWARAVAAACPATAGGSGSTCAEKGWAVGKASAHPPESCRASLLYRQQDTPRASFLRVLCHPQSHPCIPHWSSSRRGWSTQSTRPGPHWLTTAHRRPGLQATLSSGWRTGD